MRQGLFFLILIFLSMSCFNDFQKDIDKIGAPEWNPQVGLPFLSGSFTMEDYVDATSEEITVSQSEDGVVIIEYTGNEITSDYAEDLIEVPTQSFSKQIDFNNDQIIDFPISGSLSVSRNFDDDITPEAGSTDVIDSVYLKAGTLLIQIETNVAADGDIALTINTLLRDGSPISFSSGWTYDPANPGTQTINESIDLANVFGDFTKNGTTTNNFNFDATANLVFKGQPLSPTDYIRINIVIVNPKFQLVYGKFSERQFETELESVGLGLFDSVAIEGFYLNQPSVEFEFSSSYGVPVEAKIVALDAVNSDGDVLPFSGPAITNPTEVSGPGLDEVGSTVETTLIIDKSNSNITDIISFLPTELNYQFSGTVLSPGPAFTQFVLDTSRVTGSYKVVLPLDGRVARFENETTVETNSGGGESTALGESKVILKSINGLPIKVGLELIFLDEAGNELITLFKDDAALEPGETDPDGFVINPREHVLEQSILADDANHLINASTIVIKSVLNTGETGEKIVKFRMTDEVQIALFLQTTLPIGSTGWNFTF